MRKFLFFLLFALAVGDVAAQTKVQRGVTRMITRSVADPVVPVAGVQVVVGNEAGKPSDANGRFSLNISPNKEQSYQLADVRLPKGSTLILASPSKKKKLFLSKNDLEVALITPEDKNTVSKETYRRLRKKYDEQEEQLRQLRTQLEDQRLDLEKRSYEYVQLSTRIDSITTLLNQYFGEKDRENTAKNIERIAMELTLTDYQSLKTEDVRIYDLMQKGDWPTLSAYLLNMMNGNAEAYVQEAVEQKNADKESYLKSSQELVRRLGHIENAIESFKMQHLNDSVSHYYEILCKADSTNWEYLNTAGMWEFKYRLMYPRAVAYFKRMQRCASNDTLIFYTYNNLGMAYSSLGYQQLAKKYYQEALKTIGGDKNGDLIIIYNNIGASLLKEGTYSEALSCFENALTFANKNYADVDAPYLAATYNNIGTLYYLQKDFDLSLEYYTKAVDFYSDVEYSPDLSVIYFNMGKIYYEKADYLSSLSYCQKASDINHTIYGENSFNIADTDAFIGRLLIKLGNFSLASEYLCKASNILEGYILK